MQAPAQAKPAGAPVVPPAAPVAKPINPDTAKAIELFKKMREKDENADKQLATQFEAYLKNGLLVMPDLFQRPHLIPGLCLQVISESERRMESHVASQEKTLAQLVSGQAPELIAVINAIVERKLATAGINAAAPSEAVPAASPSQPAPDVEMVEAMRKLALRLDQCKTPAEQREIIHQEFAAIAAIFQALSPDQPNTATSTGRRDSIIQSLLSILRTITQPQGK